MKTTSSFINSNTNEALLGLQILSRFHCHIICPGAAVQRTLTYTDVCCDKGE